MNGSKKVPLVPRDRTRKPGRRGYSPAWEAARVARADRRAADPSVQRRARAHQNAQILGEE